MSSSINPNSLLIGHTTPPALGRAPAPQSGGMAVVQTIPLAQSAPDTCGAAAAQMAVWTLGNSSFEGAFPRGGSNLSLAEIETSLEQTTALNAYPVNPSQIGSEVKQGNPLIALLRNPSSPVGHHVLLDGWRSMNGESQVRIADPASRTHQWVSEESLAQNLATSDGTSRLLAVSRHGGPPAQSSLPASDDDGGGSNSGLSTFRLE